MLGDVMWMVGGGQAKYYIIVGPEGGQLVHSNRVRRRGVVL